MGKRAKQQRANRPPAQSRAGNRKPGKGKGEEPPPPAPPELLEGEKKLKFEIHLLKTQVLTLKEEKADQKKEFQEEIHSLEAELIAVRQTLLKYEQIAMLKDIGLAGQEVQITKQQDGTVIVFHKNEPVTGKPPSEKPPSSDDIPSITPEED